MERIALIILFTFSLTVFGADQRLNRELDFILGKSQQSKPPKAPRVVTYEDWNGETPKTEDGMIVDSTSTALAAPIRNNKNDVIVNFKKSNSRKTKFKSPRKRSR